MLREGADVVFGTCDYDYGAPAALQGQKAGKITVFMCAEDPKAGIAGIGPFSFTSSVAAQVQGAVFGEWGYEKKGWRTAYVLLDDSIEYDKSICAGFDWMFPKKGGKIVEHDVFKQNDASIASQVTRLRNAIAAQKVDVIMSCTLPPRRRQRHAADPGSRHRLPIANGSSMDGTYWLDAVPNLSNFYVPVQASIYGDDPHPEINALIKRYTEKFKEPPVTQYAFPIYAWLQLWARAVEKAGTTDATKVVAVMNTFKDEPTILGPRSFSSTLHIQDRAPYLHRRDRQSKRQSDRPVADQRSHSAERAVPEEISGTLACLFVALTGGAPSGRRPLRLWTQILQPRRDARRGGSPNGCSNN